MGIFDISSLPIRYPAPALELFQSRHYDVLRQLPHNAEISSGRFGNLRSADRKIGFRNTPLNLIFSSSATGKPFTT